MSVPLVLGLRISSAILSFVQIGVLLPTFLRVRRLGFGCPIWRICERVYLGMIVCISVLQVVGIVPEVPHNDEIFTAQYLIHHSVQVQFHAFCAAAALYTLRPTIIQSNGANPSINSGEISSSQQSPTSSVVLDHQVLKEELKSWDLRSLGWSMLTIAGGVVLKILFASLPATDQTDWLLSASAIVDEATLSICAVSFNFVKWKQRKTCEQRKTLKQWLKALASVIGLLRYVAGAIAAGILFYEKLDNNVQVAIMSIYISIPHQGAVVALWREFRPLLERWKDSHEFAPRTRPRQPGQNDRSKQEVAGRASEERPLPTEDTESSISAQGALADDASQYEPVLHASALDMV